MHHSSSISTKRFVLASCTAVCTVTPQYCFALHSWRRCGFEKAARAQNIHSSGLLSAIECEGEEAGNGVWRCTVQSDKRCLNIAEGRWPDTAAVRGRVTEQPRLSPYLYKEILWSVVK